MKKERIYSLDALKGVACLIIAFLWHYQNVQPAGLGEPLQQYFGFFYRYGKYFVELFFMISGFTMAYCYKEKIDDGLSFYDYLVKRIKHLYPLFYLTLLYMAVMQMAYYQLAGKFFVYKVSVWHFILNVFCVQTGWFNTDQSFNGPAWCISVEIFLYILFYITTYFSKRDNNKYILLTITSVFIGGAIIYGGLNYPIINSPMARGVAAFFVGVLLNEFETKWEDESKAKIADRISIILMGIGLILIVSPLNIERLFENDVSFQLSLIIVFFPMLIVSAINCVWLRRFLEIKPLKIIGTVSLEVYLLHTPVQITIKTIDKLLGLHIDYLNIYMWIGYITITMLIVMVVKHFSGRLNKRNYFRDTLVATIFFCVILVAIRLSGVYLSPIVDNNLVYTDNSKGVVILEGNELWEDFKVKDTSILEKIQFYTITWNESFDDNQFVTVSIVNCETDEKLYESEVRLNTCKDASVYEIDLSEQVIMPSGNYRIVFTSDTNESQNPLALMENYDSNGNSEGLAIKVYARKKLVN
ncbi:Peptidoglycan/LPS O-acetylase OafA/YrhL, contains acyltransferase and SGNH-hydrolase domains [Pseudobutyrivibrio ruminis]|uniref:Peptidoglycan/LPS O-acetylase OafA/YrhL, contains acyltransferase and SGNH-hydrolase domains n=1 Tax=Pseudobutyrivibrio ruminis TaxID=46206 RepID=A0A1H7F9B8_9FIRM|nr:acyltransferase [Pseudobutyrivibrio ruminis]SEK21937.1 Peptidoglycan/LPS O-acetylase OafA/YrhL, contains acyltransferase and SGNH-hydrolase domains [Pseudobutyrivibrio ruminis]